MEYVKKMIDIKWSDVKRWHKDNSCQPLTYNIVMRIPHTVAGNESEYMGYHVAKSNLSTILSTHNWTTSFDKTQVLYLDERVTVNLLIEIHQWFRQNTLNIENIVVVTTHTSGVSDWWKQWCALHQERSFSIIEWPFVRTISWHRYFNWDEKLPSDVLPAKQQLLSAKSSMDKFFSFYGGKYAEPRRFWLTLKVSQLHNHGVIDFSSKFTPTKEEIVNHVMYMGYFCNAPEEDQIAELYDQFVYDHKYKTNNDLLEIEHLKDFLGDIFCTGFQWAVDQRCFASVVRETEFDAPFSTVTEKTMRSFFHHMAVIPTGYKSVERLESLGFWFPHNLIDYQYQFEIDTIKRINVMINSIQSTVSKHSMDHLNQYFISNIDNFRHNAQLVIDYYFTDLNP